jgi:prefoldin subunit 5
MSQYQSIEELVEELLEKDESLQVLHRRLAEANARIEELEQIIKELKQGGTYEKQLINPDRSKGMFLGGHSLAE